MRQAEPEGIIHPEKLLDLWMGDQDGSPGRGPRHPGRTAVLTVLGIVVSVVLLKYALDVFLILLVLVAVGTLLHGLGIRLAESDVLSPGWFFILVLAIGLVAYAVFVPANSVGALSQYAPKWLVSALEWSVERGWGQRVLMGPGEATEQAPMPAAEASPTPRTSTSGSTATSGTSAASLVLTASSGTSVLGEPVTLMAREPNGRIAPGRTSVRFFDGSLVLGSADMKGGSGAEIAYLTVRGLAVGTHELRAEVVGPLGGGSRISLPLRHTVLPRR